MAGHIVAIGGGSLLDPHSKLETLVLDLTGTESPRVCFLATAVAEHAEPILRFYQAFGTRGCLPTHIELFGRPDNPAARLADQDVIYVSGGNTANALALWRVHGLDEALRAALERGAVLAGWSAGANCWFEDSVTDSFGPLRPLGDGLGFLARQLLPALRRGARPPADVRPPRRGRDGARVRSRRRRGTRLPGRRARRRS